MNPQTALEKAVERYDSLCLLAEADNILQLSTYKMRQLAIVSLVRRFAAKRPSTIQKAKDLAFTAVSENYVRGVTERNALTDAAKQLQTVQRENEQLRVAIKQCAEKSQAVMDAIIDRANNPEQPMKNWQLLFAELQQAISLPCVQDALKE